MSATEGSHPTESSITVRGKMPKLSASNLGRLAVFLVQGRNVLLEAPVTAAGTFQFRLTGNIVIDPCLVVVLGPKGLDDRTVLERSDLPQVSLVGARSTNLGVVAREAGRQHHFGGFFEAENR